jgi:hypothetical protein
LEGGLTATDLTRIEAALGIRLPDAYRRLVVPFPVPAWRGNADTELWDAPDRLIELNRELRAGFAFVRSWPPHLFALGRDGSGSATAIDLRDPAAPVLWADRCHLDGAGSGPEWPSLAAWAERYVADLRADLEGDAIDPDGPPEARERAEEEAARAGCRVLLVLLGLGALVVAGAWGLALWLAR